MGALLWLGLVTGSCTPEPPHFQNLVLVMVDTLRSDHLPCYGYPRDTAPHLCQLAAEGWQLDAYPTSSWTKPSVASLLTGLQPQRHQAIGRADSLPATVPYLPEELARAGFDTAAYVGNRNIGRKFGFDRGFRRFEMTRATGKVDGRRVTDETLALLPDLKSRFFLYVHYVDPHDPYRPEEPWREPGAALDRRPYVQPQRLRSGEDPMEEDTIPRLIDQYDGEIREVDEEIRQLLAALGDAGLLEGTLVVVTSDHGEEFGEHGGLTHGTTLYEELLRVPLVFWTRGGLPPAPKDRSFYQLDFRATLLEALGVSEGGDPAGDEEGTSRWRALARGADLGSGEDRFFHLDLDTRGAIALERWPTKLIHDAHAPHDRLFDLRDDPVELSPATTATPELEELRRRLVNHHNRETALAAERRRETVDDETRRGLAALGYLQLDTPQEELEERTLPERIDRDHGLAAVPPP